MLYCKRILLKTWQQQKHGNYKGKCKGNDYQETQFWGFLNQFKRRCNIYIHLKVLVMIYKTEESAVILRWFISAKYH